jgi:hypothetical protein
MIHTYFAGTERWLVARYVNDTTIAIDYSANALNNMNVWLVNY